MKYTVLWTYDAEQELAAIWLNASDRAEITAASSAIDRALSVNPLDQGESREGAIRVMFRGALAVEFEVLPDDRIVYVLSVWRIR